MGIRPGGWKSFEEIRLEGGLDVGWMSFFLKGCPKGGGALGMSFLGLRHGEKDILFYIRKKEWGNREGLALQFCWKSSIQAYVCLSVPYMSIYMGRGLLGIQALSVCLCPT